MSSLRDQTQESKNNQLPITRGTSALLGRWLRVMPVASGFTSKHRSTEGIPLATTKTACAPGLWERRVGPDNLRQRRRCRNRLKGRGRGVHRWREVQRGGHICC